MTTDDFVLSDISMEGFQLVRGQYFSRLSEPCMTIWESAVQFNAPAFATLNNCEAVQMMVNLEKRSILVKPTASKEPDAINWIRDPTNPKTTKLECSLFTRRLYSKWEWALKRRYRAVGKLVRVGKSVMLLFDFNKPEVWEGMKMVREDG